MRLPFNSYAITACNTSGISLCLQISLDGGLFLFSYLLGVVKSWFYWPFLAGLIFNFKYKKQKKKFEEENPGQLAMAWPVILVSHRMKCIGLHRLALSNTKTSSPGKVGVERF